MKKYALGFFQFIVYIVTYEIVIWMLGIIAACVSSFFIFLHNTYGIARALYIGYMSDAVLYTFYPALSALLIVLVMGQLFNNKLYLGSVVAMIVVLCYTQLFYIYNALVSYGFFSWDFLNTIWQATILCGILVYFLWKMVQRNSHITETEINCDESTNQLGENNISASNNTINGITKIFICTTIFLATVVLIGIGYICGNQNSISSSTKVYVTDHGESYHTLQCDFIRNGADYGINEVDLTWALKNGYSRCSKCNP